LHYLINHVVEGARVGNQVSKKVSHIYIHLDWVIVKFYFR